MIAEAPPVRPATEEDLVELSELLAPLPLFAAYAMTSEVLARRWREGLRRGDGMLVAELDGEPVGLCWFLKEGTFASGAYLRTLAVGPGRHGKGTGARLLEAYERACGFPAGGWFLLASDFNEGAHRFYQRYGYQEVGRLPDFGRPGIVERVFWKPLPKPR
jgi:GNAT superfamily N-acetyltransferase